MPLISSLSSTTLFPKPKNAFFTTKHHPKTQLLYPKHPYPTLKSHCTTPGTNLSAEQNSGSLEFFDEEDVLDDGYSPWEGAVVYRRNAGVSHLEYCTTLERLGLGKLSTGVSKLKASVMGLRVVKGVNVKDECRDGTPVLVSVDVARRMGKQGLRLDGVFRTVITLACNRCGEPAAEPVFSNFTLLLTEEPVEDPETIDLGIILGEEKSNFSAGISVEEDEDDEASLDMDDLLYFPPEEKEVDISKNIRDLVHLEITLNAICDPSCKGLCLRCGTNLNTGSCNCSKEGKQKSYGPLGNLKKQMQTKWC